MGNCISVLNVISLAVQLTTWIKSTAAVKLWCHWPNIRKRAQSFLSSKMSALRSAMVGMSLTGSTRVKPSAESDEKEIGSSEGDYKEEHAAHCCLDATAIAQITEEAAKCDEEGEGLLAGKAQGESLQAHEKPIQVHAEPTKLHKEKIQQLELKIQELACGGIRKAGPVANMDANLLGCNIRSVHSLDLHGGGCLLETEQLAMVGLNLDKPCEGVGARVLGWGRVYVDCHENPTPPGRQAEQVYEGKNLRKHEQLAAALADLARVQNLMAEMARLENERFDLQVALEEGQ
ncbi:uncharacterized protein VTP21DRAFT_6610 [Calcarisporiella thermophila]|uniref:uncharacterized protein n=1 Tax=Calcarisporiella thermophila TaxID=911321 RepID=UPI003742C273